MDRAPLREGRVVGRLWVAELGEEILYEEDLPGCCRKSAHGFEDYSFECHGCGATWRTALPVAEPEECAFTEREGGEERKGAA